MKNVHKLTEGAILLAAFAILIIMTVYIPVLGVATNLFLAVPFILFAAKNTKMNSFVFFIAAIILSFIVGSILALPLTFSYGLTGLVIGYCLQQKKGRTLSFLAAGLVFLFTIVMEYAAMVVLFKINFIEEFLVMMRSSIDRSVSILESLGQKVEGSMMDQFELMLDMVESLTPSLFVVASFFAVLIIELVSFPIVKRLGVAVDQSRPFREMSLPKSILWYYLLTLIASLIFNPVEGDYWYLAFVNLAFVLQICIVIQGLSFVFYYCHMKSFSKAVPIIATVSAFLFPFILSIVRILGIIDLGFELRKRLEQSNE
ncbi:uncharacterized protein YybS (DUF2232 family) [Cytobacillus eiseniae]|uniref:Uncharacterized protein YybS (DUF2232 family) n=1 Tax=Cytobacillus eiseniae TaxID=762947 RepID=A0ABS4RID1_9BACI|nr:YybS family protein [Cytobacillus eiseniae]MBP2242665.1 uncharacterized protein YybS (DUF2232 family) [Cytobacillus eiseniae]